MGNILPTNGGNWRDGALCSQTDPEMYFVPSRASTAPAKKQCGSCDVRIDCLDDALTSNLDQEGVVAGFTQKQLQHLRRQVGFTAL